MAASYAYAVGNVRAKEAALFKKQDIEQLLAADTAEKAAAFLRDKGYGEADTPLSADALLKSEEQKLWEYIRSVAPDFSVFRSFVLQNDFHNLKAVFKGLAAGRNTDSLLLSPTTVDIEVIKKAAAEQEFSLLPDFMRDAAKTAWDALIKTGDGQTCDAILDAACLESRRRFAEDIKIPMLSELINASVFYDNIKAALRCACAEKPADFIELCLTDTDKLPKARLKDAVLKGREAVLELMSGISAYGCDKAAEAFGISPTEFEKFVDNYMMSVGAKGRYIAVGAEPLIAYLQARLAEIRAVRIAVNAVATGEDRASARAMMRELYG